MTPSTGVRQPLSPDGDGPPAAAERAANAFDAVSLSTSARLVTAPRTASSRGPSLSSGAGAAASPEAEPEADHGDDRRPVLLDRFAKHVACVEQAVEFLDRSLQQTFHIFHDILHRLVPKAGR
jgi:hypothetical protein